VNSDRVEAAYRRTDLFDRRRELMEEWSSFPGNYASDQARNLPSAAIRRLGEVLLRLVRIRDSLAGLAILSAAGTA